MLRPQTSVMIVSQSGGFSGIGFAVPVHTINENVRS
jgi:S1-C subfamily serine protease